MIASPILLVTFIVAGLMLMGLASVALLRVQARQDRARLRFARVVGPYQRSRINQAQASTPGVGFAATAEGLGPLLVSAQPG